MASANARVHLQAEAAEAARREEGQRRAAEREVAREAAHSFCSQVLEVARQAADECFQTEAAAARQRELEHLARARAGKAEAETHDAGRAVAVEASHNMGEQIRPNASSHLQAEATAADERQVKKERAAREKALAKQASAGFANAQQTI